MAELQVRLHVGRIVGDERQVGSKVRAGHLKLH
jgi:hypothetical protein